MGKLIVLEGIDGSGKSTQMSLLTERLKTEGKPFHKLVFPQYDEPSSALLRMYLAGEFGTDPGDVNAYAASAFYAVDRYASYAKVWGTEYRAGGLMLADRYTTSNAVHQGSKEPPERRTDFFRWLSDFEYDKMGLPKPDLVLYLDMPNELSEQLMRRRETETHTSADIHERSRSYLAACRESAAQAAAFYGWTIVPCAENGALCSAGDIHKEIYAHVRACLEES